MQVRELYVPERSAIAITSMARVGDKIYLGLTGGPRVLAVYDIAKDAIKMEKELFPWVAGRGYCTKVHNAMGALADGSLILGEGNHFTWDGIPVTVNYFNRELPESMLARKRKQGFPDIQYTDFCLKNLAGWDRAKTDPGGVIMKYSPADGKNNFNDFGPVSTTYPRCYFHASCYHAGKLYLGETDGFSPSLHIVDLNSL